MKHFSSLLLGGALLLSTLSARAQTTGPIGQIISYQGQLSGANGAPIADGTTSVTFSIQEAGGAALFSTTQSVATIGGVFSTFLGVGNLSFDPAKSYTLSVTFNGSTATHPIAAVPMAINAKSATTATTAVNVSGVVPIANGGTGSATQPFVDLTSAQTVAGAKTFSSAVTVPQVNIGANRVLGISSNGQSVFVGPNAGAANTTAQYNVLLGRDAGDATTGSQNVFVGADAGGNNTSGISNTALGDFAGGSWTTGSNNIAIKNNGVAGESFTTRIGNIQTRVFIAGIRDVAVAGTAVIIDANGQLGTVNSSSGRFKQDVKPIGASSDWLLKLRPVSFRYTPQFLKSAAPSDVQYGLIAEEVAKVAPQMVHLDEKGGPMAWITGICR